jgi:hypothetical protein
MRVKVSHYRETVRWNGNGSQMIPTDAEDWPVDPDYTFANREKASSVHARRNTRAHG